MVSPTLTICNLTVCASSADAAIGVESYNVSLETQTAEIEASDDLAYETVLEKIKKTGKTVKSGEADGEPRDI